jgi:hypothetical protein
LILITGNPMPTIQRNLKIWDRLLPGHTCIFDLLECPFKQFPTEIEMITFIDKIQNKDAH